MDLIGVNNSIVNMRKTAVKAKIHVIRKLVKHVKDIQKKKVQNDKQKEQNERKTSRMQSELNIIKHLKRDEISRFALTNKKKVLPEINPEKDADRMDNLLKQRALVRLSNSAVLIKDVENFRKKYPTWEQELAKVLKVLGKKQQRKDVISKKKKREELKSKKKNEKISKSDNADETKLSEGDEENENLSEDEKSKDDTGMEFDNESEDEADNESENESEVESNEETEVKNEISKEKIEDRKDGEMEIKQLNLDDLMENEMTSSDDDEEEKPNEKTEEKEINGKEEKTKVKDSFFLGGEGSDDTSEEEPENDQDITEFSIDNAVSKKRNDFMGNSKFDKNREFDRNRGRGRGQFSENKRGRGDFNRGRGDFSRGRGDFGRGRGDYNRGRGDFSRGRGDFNRGRGDSYRGRGDFNRGRGDFNRGRGDFNRGRGRENHENSQEKIHPSWAAKRNQQKVVIPSQDQNGSNKKIKFDDFGGDTVVKTSNHTKVESNSSEPKNMHPSWAAKKSSKQGIQQFEGKKVVFGDDD